VISGRKKIDCQSKGGRARKTPGRILAEDLGRGRVKKAKIGGKEKLWKGGKIRARTSRGGSLRSGKVERAGKKVLKLEKIKSLVWEKRRSPGKNDKE